MRHISKKPIAIVLGAAFAFSGAAAEASVFKANALDTGYMVAADTSKAEEAKSREKKSTDSMSTDSKPAETKPVEKDKAKEMKCGEGKCGEMKKQ